MIEVSQKYVVYVFHHFYLTTTIEDFSCFLYIDGASEWTWLVLYRCMYIYNHICSL